MSRQQFQHRRTGRALDNPSTDWKEKEGVGMEGKLPAHAGFGRAWRRGGVPGQGGQGDCARGQTPRLSDVLSSFIIVPFFPDSQQSTSCHHLSGRSLLSDLVLPLPLAIQPTASRKLHSN